ncbi:aromatic ring-hydroxylating oxygenase subunit alpha [Aquabacterium sp.]|uniref:aromatic ring-hydroxylating oxygenase subunit alpha n=1 Tax=Aquabacterium sp. TaxID=1872578 RepID=UPI002CF15F1D|nr:SRPBCC family protein [Aquabacterium sp.]HSW03760.1 SRPBCC family protein [Aquabacterium sp.]
MNEKFDDRAAYVDIVNRVFTHLDAGTTDSNPDVLRVPTSLYTDPELFELEKETIFRRSPQFVCFSSDLPENGSFSTFDEMGVPVLLTRDNTGAVNAFLNACTHRAGRLKDGSGKTASLSCPYHAWGFDLKGQLRTVYEEKTFGTIDKSYYNLVRLPAEEKYGMVFVGLAPDVKVSIDEMLGEMAPLFASWNLGTAKVVNRHEWHMKTNWKLALDTFCEGYHFTPLHKATLGDVSHGNLSLVDYFGPEQRNHRVAFPNTSIAKLRDRPQSDWGLEIFHEFQLVHFLYPNISLLVSPSAIELFQLYPGKSVDEHMTRYSCYWRTQEGGPGWGVDDPQAHFEFVRDIVTKEDYWVSANVMKSLRGGLRSFNTFGRNEPALHNMHRAFARGVGRVLEQAPLVKDGQQ